MNDAVSALQEQLRSELLNGHNTPKRVVVNSKLYHELASIVDDVFENTLWGIDIIQDPRVSEYKIEY